MKEKAKIIMNENQEMIEKKEKLAYDLYINCSNPAASILDLAHSMNITSDKFISYVCSYINKNIIKPRYVTILDKLDQIPESDKVSIIEYLNSIEFSINFIENNLISYIIYYRPDILLAHDNKLLINLRKKINIYKTYLYNLNTPKKENLSRIEIATNTITKFISSEFSLERFLIHERLCVQTFKEHVGVIKTINNKEKNSGNTSPTLYDIYINHLNQKKEEFKNNIKNVIYNIINLINELGDEFSSIDLFLNTKYAANEIIKEADNILTNEEMKIFRKHVSPYRRIYIYSDRTIENLFNDRMVRNIDSERVEIDNQIKLQAINYLNDNNIPIFNDSFEKACVREYRKSNKKHR